MHDERRTLASAGRTIAEGCNESYNGSTMRPIMIRRQVIAVTIKQRSSISMAPALQHPGGPCVGDSVAVFHIC